MVQDNMQYQYTINTVPTFFYGEYSVAIVADLSSVLHNLKLDSMNLTS